MILTPGDSDRLLPATAGMVATDRRTRGIPLNRPEAVVLHSDSLNEAGFVQFTIEEIGGRGIHAFHGEGGGGHAHTVAPALPAPAHDHL